MAIYFEITKNIPFLIRKFQKNMFYASFQFYFLLIFLANENIIFNMSICLFSGIQVVLSYQEGSSLVFVSLIDNKANIPTKRILFNSIRCLFVPNHSIYLNKKLCTSQLQAFLRSSSKTIRSWLDCLIWSIVSYITSTQSKIYLIKKIVI